MRRAVGCASCLNAGYIGRTGLFELLPMTHEIADAILAGQSEVQLVALAREAGLELLHEHGLKKIYQGITSPEEILESILFED